MANVADDIERARELIAAAERLVVFTGAGVSADSGIPTFRGSGDNSFWGKYDPQQLATPEGFATDPQLVYDWYNWRRSQLAHVQPNAAHHAIAGWQKTKRATVITQNVDGLHERLASPAALLLRLHGSLADDRCCGCEYRESVDFHNLPKLRKCSRCGALMRPDVVWFGEALDAGVWEMAEQAASDCDLMLVVGTSGEVYPAAGLVHIASRRGEVIIVNLDPGSLDQTAAVALHGKAGEIVPKLA
jgi:NAD-dependent deacetylase